MKKLIYLPIVLGIAMFASCENAGETTEETAVDSVAVIEETTTIETPAVTEETLTSEEVVADTTATAAPATEVK